MATREVLQEGRTVYVDSKGNKTYGPMPPDESGTSPSSKTLGAGAAAQAAQAILDARRKRDAEAGYKRGGPVAKKTVAKVAPKKPAARKPLTKRR